MLNEDYKEMLQCLSGEGVKFLLVGAYAMAAHGYPRSTVDIDFWVMPSTANAEAVLRALRRFGATMFDLGPDDLLRADTVFHVGVPPRRIDIMTGATGLDFDDAYGRAAEMEIDGKNVRILALDDLIRNKRATGRTKDLADAEALEDIKRAKATDRPGNE